MVSALASCLLLSEGLEVVKSDKQAIWRT